MSSAQPTLDDIWLLFKETDRKFQETDRKMQETDRKMQETDRQIQETARIVKETGLKVDKVSESIGRLGNKLGAYVEEMVKPAVVRLFQERGIDVHEVHRGVEAKRGDDNIEIDLLVVNSTDVVAVECKSSLSVDDVNEHLVALQKLKKLLPTYADKRVMGAAIYSAPFLYVFVNGVKSNAPKSNYSTTNVFTFTIGAKNSFVLMREDWLGSYQGVNQSGSTLYNQPGQSVIYGLSLSSN